ncbi:hypothetical protein Q4566_08415 [Tamlana sp. 2_MG-2023]|uniref:hypothetical protein n=1 Tax=unclassified Tamlana TaxID=2614803 RepID=UPI0026E47C89|nr:MULTISPECIES: hypothetical protein [unclassified Tamlana]MDO6760216.1 hypothetical protein [Tamlana sp. 2_MG-2023]MDO6790086.1 hypothetical protein [Tamlana sp. 1_MG-2023]
MNSSKILGLAKLATSGRKTKIFLTAVQLGLLTYYYFQSKKSKPQVSDQGAELSDGTKVYG